MSGFIKLYKFIDVLSDLKEHNVQELATEVGVSVSTIKRYKVAIEEIYFEIESKRGRYGYYRLKKIPAILKNI